MDRDKRRTARREAWMRLAWATRPHPERLKALRRHEPDLSCLGERLVQLAEGDDAGLVAPLGPLDRRYVNTFRSPATGATLRRLRAWAETERHHHLLTIEDIAYPVRLRLIETAPTALSLIGSRAALDPPALAVVGSRNASPAGLSNARQFSRDIAAAGLSIVSGLAIGIDSAAHEGALEAGGITLAVMGTGPDQIYPARHAALAARIAERGALLTEYAIGHPPLGWGFPLRNRVISGIAYGTLVVEASPRSGTLTTAQHALDQSGTVFAIPGPIHQRQTRGCHELLRDGARLVVEPAQVIEELVPDIARELAAAAASPADPLPARPMNPSAMTHVSVLAPVLPLPDPGSNEARVLESLAHEDATADRIADLCLLDVGSVLAAASVLEIRGLIRRDGCGGYARCKRS